MGASSRNLKQAQLLTKWPLALPYYLTLMESFEFDVFISHASEDKADFAEPLAKELLKWGLNVWFDKFTLRVGDSLRDSIETGLSRSRYGIVIFSKYFLSKNWPKAELSGLFTREMVGHKVILPVWHNISSDEMKAHVPIQADKVALRSSDGAVAVAKSLIEVIRPELLEVDARKASVFGAGDSFIEVARSKHPGYDFSVHSGGLESPVPGAIFSAKQGNHRIGIHISDPSLITDAGEPISSRTCLTAAGAVSCPRLRMPPSRISGGINGIFHFKSSNSPECQVCRFPVR